MIVIYCFYTALGYFTASSWPNNTITLQTGNRSVEILCETNHTLANLELQFFKYGDIKWTLSASYNDNRIAEQEQVFNIKPLIKVDEGFYRCYAIKHQIEHHLYLGYLGFGGFLLDFDFYFSSFSFQ